MRRFEEVIAWSIAVLICLATSGCGPSSKPNETIRGLQEENKVLREQIELLQNNKQASDSDLQKQIEDLKRTYEESLTRERELHQTQVSQLEKEISTLRLELGSTQREKIALQEIVDREPRIRDATAALKATDLWVLVLLLAVSLIVLALVAFRYRSVSDRLHLLTMQHVSELRRIGGEV